MKTIYLNDNTAPLEPSVATIGFFDGVHRGHQFLISHVRQEAAHSGLQSLVVTFDRHPRQVLRKDYQPELLSTLDSKLLLLSKTGVDTTALLHFDEAMASLSARDFMALILRDRLNVRSSSSATTTASATTARKGSTTMCATAVNWASRSSTTRRSHSMASTSARRW